MNGRESSHHTRLAWSGMVLVLLPWAGAVSAAEALYLNWGGCPAAPTATSTVTASCLGNSGENALYGAFRIAQPLDSVVSLTLTIDIQHSDAAVPAWWQLAPGGCRYGALAVDELIAPFDSCSSPWPAASPSPKFLIQSYAVGQPRGGANQARLIVTAFVTPDQAATLAADQIYVGARIGLRNTATTSCSGCADPACLVLNSVVVGRLPVDSGRDVPLVTPGAGNANRVTWQSSSASCAAVPVRTTTWGAMKSLYR